MLRSLKDLESYAIEATDGPIGQVKDFYFDDEAWLVRYLVVETGSWLSSRKVLIAPRAIRDPSWHDRLLSAFISKAQVKNSPDINTDKPVSRQHETEYLGYYGYPVYWGSAASHPGHDVDAAEQSREEAAFARADRDRHRDDDPHLRSFNEVIGYRVHATDGEIGQVEGLLVEEGTWVIRYLVVNTGHWWAGRKVLLTPEWITHLRWTDQSVTVDVSRTAIQNAPPYDSMAGLNRQREIEFYESYDREGYWAAAAVIESEIST